jgi:uncharacterized membrane protein YfcA
VEVSERIFDIALAIVLVLVVITVFLPAPGAAAGAGAGAGAAAGAGAGAAAGAGAEAERPANLVARRDRASLFRTVRQWVLFFFAGIYGGFVQSGVGFLLIAVISLSRGLDLVATNAIKVSVVIVFGAISLAIFAWNGMVVWSAGLLLGAGTMIGAWIGVHSAVRHGAGFIRWVVVASAGAAALRLLGVL